MSKKSKIFSSILKSNRKAISYFYYKYIFLIIIFGCILTGIIFYKLDAHIILFGDTPSALGEYVKTVATGLGGALVILGLWINNRRVAEQTRQNNIAEKGQINTRFKDAATLLGSGNVSSVISGIYALHQIALESSEEDDIQRRYVNIIHDILCTYVRENTDTIINEDTGKEWRVNSEPTIVIQTIMKVLFKNNEFIYSDYMTDLSNCVFEDIDFDNAHFSNVDFTKTKFIRSTAQNCSFTSCYMENSFMDGMDFSDTSFDKVIFDSSHIKNTSFVSATLKECDFWNTIIFNSNFDNTRLNNVDFKDCIFEGDITFNNTILEKYTLEEIRTKSDILTKLTNNI
ncbi:pentapeptide repeat-containing protein [Dysgonomonas sp. Marseille-P4677]|uniref:pentapeptide repeat-containing protein n=1 Tax=Dysgonomonas sp. Marseille-P4677 TaxID=2364790 RepID=UPI00191492B2|nr:pentapeptide repeat-containing protein [Dysgonomonas sp. Marseille-P4677]MBK5722768.1 pentapeptide repeat-containing protein [Dysgonomonas sp. Marseille-P4677]